MVGRYRLIEEVQTLPYRVVRAERLEDCDGEEDYSEQTQHITALLIELLGRQEKELAKILTSDDWADQTSSEFSNRFSVHSIRCAQNAKAARTDISG